ncbi:MAG: 4'-phosphopantetheinyl transferase superfamily protein [Elusimicrobiota bacterium]|nr:MAG: 4'-phosphopantetheinyl transferase superfamily protein [Elusimicrobiota bacterium]
MALDAEDVKALRVQWAVSRALVAPVSLLVAAISRFYFGYELHEDVRRLRREIWAKLDAHPGPVIWAANHLTLIDSFLVYWAVFPTSRVLEDRRIPWSTPEYTNYYKLGGPVQSAFLRGLLYLCRCIPFLRGGEDAAAETFRQKAFEKCAWVLKQGGAVFVYPEAGRSRSGWLEPKRPKDFLGRLALEAPDAKFLVVYLRSERQISTTACPPYGDRIRVVADLVEGARPGDTNPRAISQRLFDRLAELQRVWWDGSDMARNCGGNDVVDLKGPLLRENFSDDLTEADQEWLERHLTKKELSYLAEQGPAKLFRTFWKFFCAKEACHKALGRAVITVPNGAFHEIEIDLFRNKAVHIPTGLQLDTRFTDDDEDKLHCVAVLRGGFIGDADTEGDVLWTVAEVPAGTSPGGFVRELALDFIAGVNDEIGSSAKLALTDQAGLPGVLWKGKPQDWSLSLSHSGRFAAASFMIS